MADFDVVVVGGGINGAGIARDLAGRGWRVLLAERDDLAGHTSSCSTKLVHGGLRYLEHREFALVAKSLREREVLMRAAPHLIWPLRFVLPHAPEMRPAWLIRLGLFLYDHLARRELLPGSHAVRLTGSPLGAALKAGFTRGFVYSDGWADDARLVVLNAMDARERGAEVLSRCGVAHAQRGAQGWSLRLDSGRVLSSRALVNATGPWAEAFLRAQSLPTRRLRLVKGSHIVVRQRFTHDHAYLFQNPDGRILFAIPYEGEFTLIGTTDFELDAQAALPAKAEIEASEVDYLCQQASRYLAAPVTSADVLWTYAGVRPLIDDAHGNAAQVTRDYLVETEPSAGAPLLNVWGGKLTTYRQLAEDAAGQIGALLGRKGAAWTAKAVLPGGDLDGCGVDFAAFLQRCAARWPQLPGATLRRLARAYGSRIAQVLARELGREVAPGLFEAELHHLVECEWACSAEDVLWRRSKLGLHYTPEQQGAVAEWLQSGR